MNRILYAADCLAILDDEAALPTHSVDLIYLDPPFNSNSRYNLPFKGRDKAARPVEAFSDTWHWRAEDKAILHDLDANPRTRPLAAVVKFAQTVEQMSGRRASKSSLSAYLLSMAIRLLPMRRVLKDSGSIYLHCDPTASHYLKLLMDAIFGHKNFRNEIVWCYTGNSTPKSNFLSKHDIILFYAKSKSASFNPQHVPYSAATLRRYNHIDEDGRRYKMSSLRNGLEKIYIKDGKPLEDWWADIPVIRSKKERLGYPTQKPLALLERIIKASSRPGDLVLDPFCGCGTTIHAAEQLKRRWIGIDISPFATGLMRERIVDHFPAIQKSQIALRGTPDTVAAAQALAQRDQFEFEKWVCGTIGAEGMFHEPGTRGADGGVDGLLKFYPLRPDKKLKPEYAIVQVKGGRVSPDSVRALRETVARFEVKAGVLVCFEKYMPTVENQRSHDTFQDAFGIYPVIQGYSIESLLKDVPLKLPLYGGRRRGAALT